MNAAVAIAQTYAPTDFQEPAGLLVDWPSSDQRTALRVAKKAKLLLVHLQFVADMKLDGVSQVVIDDRGGQAQEESIAALLSLLEAMRYLHRVLEGAPGRRLLSDVEQFAPRLKGELAGVMRAAMEQLKEMRATLAFLLDERDDIELGVDLVPPFGAPRPAEDSTPAR